MGEILSSFYFESSLLPISLNLQLKCWPFSWNQVPVFNFHLWLQWSVYTQQVWDRTPKGCWHHHCTHHQPLTILELSQWSFLSSSWVLSQGDILHDACMCQGLCEVLEGDEQSDMVPGLKSLHSNRGAIQGRKCWVPQERQPRKAAWLRAALTSPAGEEFHRPWRDKDVMSKGSQESKWLKWSWNAVSVCWFMPMAGGSTGETWLRSTVWVEHRRANHSPFFLVFPYYGARKLKYQLPLQLCMSG